MAQRDLQFLSRQFETFELPRERKYLLKYFDTPLQTAFIRYVCVFNDYANFTDHTGIPCKRQHLKRLYERFLSLEKSHRDARAAMDMTALAKIESGKHKSFNSPSE